MPHIFIILWPYVDITLHIGMRTEMVRSAVHSYRVVFVDVFPDQFHRRGCRDQSWRQAWPQAVDDSTTRADRAVLTPTLILTPPHR